MDDRLVRPRSSPPSILPYDHPTLSRSRSPLAVIWIKGLPVLWTKAESFLKESTVTAVTNSCVVGNATELLCPAMSSDVWEAKTGDQSDNSGPVYPTWALVLMGLMAGCMSLVTVSGNLIVILSFFLERAIRQPTNYFIASLAVSDLLIGAVSMPFYTVYLLTGQHWPLGEILCDLWLSVDYTVCLCSIYTVFCITIDRFCSVRIPAKYRNWRTERKVLAVVALTWVVPVLVFFPSVFGWQCIVGERTVPKGKCYVQYMEDALFNCFLQVGYFWVTLCAMCGLYAGIYRVALNLQKKSDLKQKTTSLVSSAGQKMARIGSRVDDRPGRKEDAPKKGAEGRGCRIVNNGGCDRKNRGGDVGDGDMINSPEEEREDSPSSPDYPDIVLLDEKPDGRRLSARFIHHVDHVDVEDRVKEQEKEDMADGTKNSVEVSSNRNAVKAGQENAVLMQNQQRKFSRDLKFRPSGNFGLNEDADNGSSPSLFAERPLTGSSVRKTRKAVLIEKSAGRYDDPEFRGHFEVRWLSEDDLESKLFEENVRLLIRSHRIDSSTTDSAGEEPGSPIWKKRDSPSEHSLLVAVDVERPLQYQSTLHQAPSATVPKASRNCSRRKRSLNYSQSNSFVGGSNDFDTRKVSKGYRRVFARIMRWRDSSKDRADIDDVQTPPTPNRQGVYSSLRRALNNGEIELKHFGGRGSAMDPVGTTTGDQGESDQPCSNQSSLRAQGSAAPFQTVLRRLRKFDDSQNKENASDAGRKCKRVNRARKALRTITVILGAFVLCWTPWHVLSMIIGFCPKGIVCVAPVLYDISYWLCYLNSPLNPFCYALANQQFKKTFARILKFDWHRT